MTRRGMWAGADGVIVVGGGMAGLAAATSLARAGCQVTCVEPDRFPRARVGESLDWSSPWLLHRLGLRTEELVAAGWATFKCDIEAITADGDGVTASPPRLLAKRPFGATMTTVHLDRQRFDEGLFDAARRAGVAFEWDSIADIEMEGDRVVVATTRGGRRLTGAWWIDASGTARLIGRSAGVPVRYHAGTRVCLWTQLRATRAREGTTLSLDTSGDELEWAWEIPLAEDRQSVGLVMPAHAFRALPRRSRPLRDVLAEQLGRFSRYRGLDADDLGEVRARTYRPYVAARIAGANWLLAGESAVLVDPLTSLGVTAALRNGTEAAAAILVAEEDPQQGARAIAEYERRVRCIGDLYNSAIERLLYQPDVRRAFGWRTAGLAYVLLGYGTNTLYTRMRPTTGPKTTVLEALAAGYRAWTNAWLLAAGVKSWQGGRAHDRIDARSGAATSSPRQTRAATQPTQAGGAARTGS